MPRCLVRAPDGERIGGTVALDDDSTQAEQARAVVPARIDAPLETLEYRIRNQREQLRRPVARELFLHHARKQAREALGGLERHVADESVANDDVGRPFVDVVAFD